MKLLFLFAIFFFSVPATGQRYVAQPSDFSAWTPQWGTRLNGYRLMDVVRSYATEHPISAKTTVWASSCALPVRLKDFLGAARATITPDPKVDVSLLSRPASSLVDIFKVIQSTPTGKAILNKFIPVYGYTFKIKQITPSIRQLLRSQRPVAVFQPETKTLYFDKQREIGRVAFILLHEIVHSLDKDAALAFDKITGFQKAFEQSALAVVNRTARMKRKRRSNLETTDFAPEDIKGLVELKRQVDQMMQIRSYKTERLAYDASYQVWSELADLYPSYYRRQRGRQMASLSPIELSDSKLIRVMRFNPHYINAFRSGRCRLSSPLHFSR